MSFLSEQGKAALENNKTVHIAHLLALQLPGSGAQLVYFTDFGRDIEYQGNTYKSGQLKSVSKVRQTKSLTNYNVTIQVTGADSNELERFLNSTAYIGKRITIKRLFMDANEQPLNLTLTEPAIHYFAGEVTGMDIKENLKLRGKSTSVITWTCASLLNNFTRVNGRMTDDASHRGLVAKGGKQVPSASAKKVEYQSDKGFFHSNQSINVLAQYQTKELRYKMVAKKGKGLKRLLGIKSYEQVEYWADVTKEVDMDINLTAKYLPILYGVQRTSGIPVFVDTNNDNPDEVWAVFAFCEGEIDGFLDFYIDDKPIICTGEDDANNRVCFGRKRINGDTLAVAKPANDPVHANTTEPTKHGESYTIDDGEGEITLWVYHGKSSQTADPNLVKMAKDRKFKLQNSLNKNESYWDDSFKLLDTAYVVMKMDITSERTNIPSIEAEVQGKKVAVYNESGIVSKDRTSLNFAWQTMDYLTSPIYGAGIPLELLPIQDFVTAAALMDVQDDSYQTGWVPFWRYLGWEKRLESMKAVMQGSAILDTSTDVFKNLQIILQQADASLNIVNGKYRYSIEALKPAIRDIHIDDILPGSFSLIDTTNRSKYNSIQAAISDPALGWNTNTITFYNEQFLLEDLNKENKGSVTFPFITNYYTARSRAERLLNRSRFTKKIGFRLPFMYADIAPNEIITLTHPRYSWVKKQFLVDDVSWSADGKIDVTALEYSAASFINSEQSDASEGQGPAIVVDVLPARNLRYIPEPAGGPEGVQGRLTWDASFTKGVSFYSIKRTGSLDIETVTVPPTSPASFEFPVRGLTPGEYTFQVRAANAQGKFSAPVNLSVNVDPTLNLPMVTNFRYLNTGDASREFVDRFVDLVWDDIPDKPANTSYTIEVTNPDGVIIRTISTTGTSYNYGQLLNMADYATVNNGALGIYRTLGFRIKAKAPGGALSVGWAVL